MLVGKDALNTNSLLRCMANKNFVAEEKKEVLTGWLLRSRGALVAVRADKSL